MLEVDRLVAAELYQAGSAAEAVVPEELHGAVQDGTRGLVIVKEITPQEDEIDLRRGEEQGGGFLY